MLIVMTLFIDKRIDLSPRPTSLSSAHHRDDLRRIPHKVLVTPFESESWVKLYVCTPDGRAGANEDQS